MLDEENQMGLFEILGTPPELKVSPLIKPPPAAVKPAASPRKPAPAPTAKAAAASQRKPAVPPAATPAGKRGKTPATPNIASAKKVSGLVPEGDVRLTANIRQDLHLKLKIASAHRRTTIGEILEELIDAYL